MKSWSGTRCGRDAICRTSVSTRSSRCSRSPWSFSRFISATSRGRRPIAASRRSTRASRTWRGTPRRSRRVDAKRPAASRARPTASRRCSLARRIIRAPDSVHRRCTMKVSRRRVLVTAAGAVALGRTAGMQSPAPAPAPSDPSKAPGRPARTLGQRAAFEKPQRIARGATSSQTPHQDLYGTITPADLHFERHHAGVPEIDPKSYSLLIHGMVERPTMFTLADLKRFPSVSRVCFLECSGNFNRAAPPEITPQQLAGLTSQSEWTGVMLSTLLREVGARPQATWFLAEGHDAALLARSIPVEKAFDDAMIAYAQNGEAIRPEQGYPARLLLPGWEGNSNVK